VRPARDPAVDYRALVRDGYDRCAAAYSLARMDEPEPVLDLLTERLGAGARVLDTGCGAGVPVSRALAAQGFTVTGIDFSAAMIDLARRNVPQATFLCQDVLDVKFDPGEFDAVVAFYAIFHIPKEQQPELFRRIHHWLKPNGYLLATLTHSNEAGYTEDGFFGETMYWSNFSLTEYEDLLRDAGFSVLASARLGHGYGDEEAWREESHPLLFAQKRQS